MYENDRIIRENKEFLKNFQRKQTVIRKGRRGPYEVRCGYVPDTNDGRAEVQDGIRSPLKTIADISREFLKIKKVYRWHLKKVSGLGDNGVISVCHRYVEENGLNDEWERFREEHEDL